MKRPETAEDLADLIVSLTRKNIVDWTGRGVEAIAASWIKEFVGRGERHVVIHAADQDVKIVGVYSSRERAEAAVSRARTLPGFRDHPDGFHIDVYHVDKDHWAGGFGSVGEMHAKHAIASGAKPRTSKHPYKPTGS